MQTLAQATLTSTERRVLDRFVELAQAELGPRLRSAWLYGSRARAVSSLARSRTSTSSWSSTASSRATSSVPSIS
jgi:hypothetical protein